MPGIGLWIEVRESIDPPDVGRNTQLFSLLISFWISTNLKRSQI
jgi:hypothetical protein